MNKKRIVIKIGSNLLVRKNYILNKEFIESICRQISKLYNEGNEIIIVTSGAVGTGLCKLNLLKRIKSLREKQAAAAVGQPLLMRVYEEYFSKYDIPVAQILLTRDDFNDRNRYLNMRNTILSLLNMRVIPIINENDTVAIEEIKFGDNDTLSALVSSKIDADILIILSDIDGLYTNDPNKDKNAELISEVKEITNEIENYAGKNVGSDVGTGGMYTKIQASKIAVASGVEVVIANGNLENVIMKIINKERIGTRFIPKRKEIDAKKRWIAFIKKVNGKLFIDDGAVDALINHNKSLLPSGIISVEGKFEMGDTVSVVDKSGNEIARGLVYYSSDEVNIMKGKKSSQIKKILNRYDFEEVIHRDNLVIL
jgi:glutamate 5-kinase